MIDKLRNADIIKRKVQYKCWDYSRCNLEFNARDLIMDAIQDRVWRRAEDQVWFGVQASLKGLK